MNIVILYALFAAIATMANIGSQDLVIRIYDGVAAIPLSVFIGTGVGLLVKYLLDKKWIFRFKVANVKHDASTFALYTTMGVITTAVFWLFEFGFNHAFHTRDARYVGGVIGLTIGYVTKYHLDKRFVFAPQRST